jgi:isochorismate synthase
MSTSTVASKQLDFFQQRQRLMATALLQNLGVACWRLPNQANTFILLAEQIRWVDDLTLEELPSGFAMSPFRPSAQKLFLEGTHLFEVANHEISETTHGQFLERALMGDEAHEAKFYQLPDTSVRKPDDYVDLVKLCINAIDAGSFEKIVPSMSRQIAVSADYNLLNAFDALSRAYPNAMISLVSHPAIGTWLGASPELLVSIDKNNIFRTVALAGTQAYQPGTSLRSISWTQKEIEEQALVERYIINCFKKIRVREYEEHGPKTVQAGNLLHLRSDFEVNMKDLNYPQLGSVMLKLLHPTSAVCGMPMEAAFQFLEANEGYDREFYAGYLGPVNVAGESHLFVNLRCVKWCGDYWLQFAGAGVTIDSVPEAECNEVNIKLDTVRKALAI